MAMKKLLFFFLKITLTCFILYLLISSGKLDLSQLKIFLNKWHFFILLIIPIFLLTMLIQNFRWWLILKCFNINIKFFDAFLITWIGNFFNSTLPGLVSGDVIKGLYLKNKNIKLIPIYTSFVIDRLLGLFGLLIIFLIANFKFNLENSAVNRSLSIFTFISIFSIIIIIIILFYPLKSDGKVIKFLSKLPKKDFFISLYKNFILLKNFKLQLVVTVFLSISIHLLLLLVFYQVSLLLNISVRLGFWEQANLIPLGLIVTAIPISPAGIGVGHLAFENLYNLFGSSDGANIFNLFILSQISVFLFGIIPFIFYKKKKS